MSISSALNNALTGLNAASRSAELISNNVANALTPGYARRSIELSAANVGGRGAGVAVSGIRLEQDLVAISSRRLTDADIGAAVVRSSTLAQLTAALGTPDQPGALATRAVEFESALIAASNDPASNAALSNLANTALQYGNSISQLSTETRRIRMDADAQITQQVGEVNSSLKSIELLNREIKMRSTVGGDIAALENERQQLIDRVSNILPIRTASRPGNEVALFTTNGAILVDGPASELGFTQTGLFTQDMTLASGALSGLTLNGSDITVGDGSGSGLLDGGSLSALFEVRDVTAPAFNDQLDALAADLVERFQNPAVDPTLLPGDAGLFTDGGNAYSSVDQFGLASRLELNAAVDPANGGEVWRLRDGINAATQGNVGSPTILTNLLDAAQTARAPVAGLGIVESLGLSGFASEFTTQLSTRQYQADSRSAFLNTLGTSLREAEAATSGVDTDSELQKLILVEQAYAANARVMSVVDSLMHRLLEI